MALVTRPRFEPLELPEDTNPVPPQEFESLAAETFAGFDEAVDAAASQLADLADTAASGEAAADSLGLDLAAGAEQLAALRDEAEAEDLQPDLAAAAAADQALGSTEVALPDVPKIEGVPTVGT